MNEKTARKGQKCNDERKTCKKRALATLHSFVLQSRTVPLCINGPTGATKKNDRLRLPLRAAELFAQMPPPLPYSEFYPCADTVDVCTVDYIYGEYRSPLWLCAAPERAQSACSSEERPAPWLCLSADCQSDPHPGTQKSTIWSLSALAATFFFVNTAAWKEAPELWAGRSRRGSWRCSMTSRRWEMTQMTLLTLTMDCHGVSPCLRLWNTLQKKNCWCVDWFFNRWFWARKVGISIWLCIHKPCELTWSDALRQPRLRGLWVCR